MDDEQIVREGMALLLSLEPDLEIVGQTGRGPEALTLTKALLPDVVVMDVRMPGQDGVETTRMLIEASADPDQLPKVLMVTTFPDAPAVYDSLRAGASGFVLKYSASRDLVSAVRSVAAGDAWIDPRIAPQVIAALANVPGPGQPAPQLIQRLTPREREVLVLIARGLDNSKIAEQLVLSAATVKTHVSRILLKTGCHDRAGSVVIAYESGLVTPGGIGSNA